MPTPSKAPQEDYRGFEQGPIRPPSEANSLLIRVTRNCPWNRCAFCPVYKGSRFSIRPTAHVIQDIDAVWQHIEDLQQKTTGTGGLSRYELRQTLQDAGRQDLLAFNAALNWYTTGMHSIFLQDANSLIVKPSNLITILSHLQRRFGEVERITSYARSHTIARIKTADLQTMRAQGLNRIHIGLESGSDQVLKRVRKGVSQATQIKAGLKVVQAGMQLSEYVMPGLGGRDLSRTHALETAKALNQINPHFIRLRTLALPNSIPLFDEWQAGRFDKCSDVEMAQEILLFLENLNGITSVVKSDHILNLFQEVEGTLPQDKDHMTGILKEFLGLTPEQQCLYQVGRRLGVFTRLSDMQNTHRRQKTEQVCRELGVTPDNVDQIIDELMKRFI
jgi:hypothetical protein